MKWKRPPPATGPEARLKDIQNRFRAIRQRYDRAVWRRRALRRGLNALLLLCLLTGLAGAALWASPWPAGTTVRHVLAFPNCDAARAVGLAPAFRGAPGYYTRHDRDRDGISCEPFSRLFPQKELGNP